VKRATDTILARLQHLLGAQSIRAIEVNPGRKI
jgi:hypothetical protein